MLHSNPGDYAWGQSGLDAIVTQVRPLCVPECRKSQTGWPRALIRARKFLCSSLVGASAGDELRVSDEGSEQTVGVWRGGSVCAAPSEGVGAEVGPYFCGITVS